MNVITELAPVPKFRPKRPDFRSRYFAGGQFRRIANQIWLYGFEYTPFEDILYIIKHEMLHFVLTNIDGTPASICLDNIAKFGDLL